LLPSLLQGESLYPKKIPGFENRSCQMSYEWGTSLMISSTFGCFRDATMPGALRLAREFGVGFDSFGA
jgi:hypothetical protein